MIWRHFGIAPDAADDLPWWQRRFALEGLQWEANAQADGGDVWPDEQVRMTREQLSAELAKAGVRAVPG